MNYIENQKLLEAATYDAKQLVKKAKELEEQFILFVHDHNKLFAQLGKTLYYKEIAEATKPIRDNIKCFEEILNYARHLGNLMYWMGEKFDHIKENN
jgi:hypothetical protein